MADLYQHLPLSNPHSIRVLKLHPSYDEDSPIVVDLVEVTTRSKPKYYALSYTWGGQQLSCPIRCGSKILLTTPNCLAALRQLRNENSVEVYWIDSICIDQTSLSERSEQVALMGEIYRDAYMVIAWLGKGDPATEGAIECLKSLVDTSNMNPLDDDAYERALHEKVEDLIKGDQADQQALSEEESTGRKGRISPLFKRAWFSRLWTVQEVALADMHNVQVVCGKNTIRWITLLGATQYLLRNGYDLGNYRKVISLQKDLSIYIRQHLHPDFRMKLEQRPRYNMYTPSVSHILALTRDKSATEPRDMVFGLLGIFTALGIESFVPDYTKSVEEIYRQAAIMAILHDKSLDILFEAASDNRRADLNSWVPDWSDAGYSGKDMRAAMINKHFCACGPTNPRYHFSTAQNYLHLRGKLLDTVTYRAETMNMKCINEVDTILRIFRGGTQGPSGDDRASLRDDRANLRKVMRELHGAFQVMRAWTNVSTWYAGYPAPGETPKTALRRTLLYDDPETNGEARLNAAFESWYQVMTTSDAGLDHLAWGGQRTTTSKVMDPEEERSMRIMGKIKMGLYFHGAMIFSNRKCLFTTEEGYLGTGPDLIQHGDRIAVFAGLCMPFVVRPVGNGRFWLVTHAYVHGIMYGQAWEGDADGARLDEIVLV
ncbi:MAG: hypothetical protein Q9205_007139 [Flavoplaca limonia]